MPKVVFWNVQRSKGLNTGTSDSGVTVGNDIAGIADRTKPDAIVLCELINGYSDSPPIGYTFSEPSTLFADYFNEDTLRYGLITPENSNHSAFLLPTSDNFSDTKIRPALGVVLNGSVSFVALHAISSTSADRKKIAQAEYAATEMENYFNENHKRPNPDVLFGDFNINLANIPASSVNEMIDKKGPLAGYKVRATKSGTQVPGGNKLKEHDDFTDTSAFISKLDWALLSPDVLGQASIQVLKPQKLSDNSIRDEFKNEKRSDHLPIVVEW